MWCSLSAQQLRWLALVGAVLSCVGLVSLVARVPRETPAQPHVGNSRFAMHNFRSDVYENDRRWSVSGDALILSQAKLMGPFRLGFAHALVGHNITIETFPQSTPLRSSDTRPVSVHRMLTALAPSLARLLSAALPGQSKVTLARAECGPLKIISHDGTDAVVLFSAATCRTNLGLTKVSCTEGMVRSRGSVIPFQELSYNGQHWKLRTTLGQTKQVDELMDFRLR